MCSMAETGEQLHVAFFPFMTPGHSIPMLDLVRLFVARGVKTTVFTTPLNAPDISKYLNIRASTNNNDLATSVYITPFPSIKAGLPEGVESQDRTTSPEMSLKFFLAMELLKHPLEQFLKDTKPNCLIADNFFPYATDVAKMFDIPRVVFQSTGCFSMCVMMALSQHQPQNSVASDNDFFIIPNLPHEIKLTKSQLQPDHKGSDDEMNASLSRLFGGVGRALFTSYGIIFNSFTRLESEYVDYFNNVVRKPSRVWHLGPVSLCNRQVEGKSIRGKSSSINENICLKWLNDRKPNSVIYVSFGSLTCFSASQLREIAIALECFGRDFIWVLRGGENVEEWLPKGFEERVKSKGLIIRGWAPQVLILDHEVIGGFVTHCGWNSILESISAGVPMVTWPVYAEQFYNEKLVADVLKVGVKVGSMHWSDTSSGTFLEHEKIGDALKEVMDGEGMLEMRERAKKLKEMAYEAVEEGGSSYCQLSSLIDQLSSSKNGI
ncbi:hypothetical protein RND81_10G193200 [Saponaria officinalis]|uniref:Glycosyltransferase n=1 Tax=Saponaria officinalis TaxID=3572 RepID=A0AAW1I6N2_SAPOF